MATVHREISIAAPPDRVWAIVHDFHSAPLRMAPGFVTDSAPDGPDTRVVTFVTGTVARERLVACDDATRRIVYSIVGGTVAPDHDNASMQVLADGAGGCRFIWVHDVLPDDLAAGLGTGMDHGLAALKRTAEREGR